MDEQRRFMIVKTPGHRDWATVEDLPEGATTAQLGEGETNDAFFESIAGVDYAEVERRFMVLDPKAFMREVPPNIDLYRDGLELKKIAGNYGYVDPDELRPSGPPINQGNRKERRAQAARARDKRWRIKL